MKISIITVTYNSEAYIKTCITSVLSQTYPDVEYIIIDGASTDGTLEVVKSFGVRYVSEKDNGIYDAINKGISLVSGDVIGILNSDDFFADSGVISRIAAAFERSEEPEAVFSDILFVDNSDINKVIRYYSSRNFRPFMFRFGFQPAHPSFYVKRHLFRKYGHYRTDLKIAGDFELLLRFIFKHKIQYIYISDLWVKMRLGGVSTSGVKSVLRVNNEILQACRLNGVYTNKAMIYAKYFVKWWGFIRKNREINKP